MRRVCGKGNRNVFFKVQSTNRCLAPANQMWAYCCLWYSLSFMTWFKWCDAAYARQSNKVCTLHLWQRLGSSYQTMNEWINCALSVIFPFKLEHFALFRILRKIFSQRLFTSRTIIAFTAFRTTGECNSWFVIVYK